MVEYKRPSRWLRSRLWIFAAAVCAMAPAGAVEDPFRPPAFAVAPSTSPAEDRPVELQVSMILHGPGRSSAVIGGRTLGVGDRIQGFTVAAIRQNRVILDRDGRRIELEPANALRPIRSSDSHSPRQSTGTP